MREVLAMQKNVSKIHSKEIEALIGKSFDENGFYENYIRGKTSIVSLPLMFEKDKKWGITNNYRLHSLL